MKKAVLEEDVGDVEAAHTKIIAWRAWKSNRMKKALGEKCVFGRRGSFGRYPLKFEVTCQQFNNDRALEIDL